MTEYEQKMKSALDEVEALNAHMARELEETEKSNKRYFELKQDTDAVISGLKEQIVTLTDKLTAETARADKTAQKYEDLDNKYTEALTAVVNLQAEAGSWKQVAKWLIKQMGSPK